MLTFMKNWIFCSYVLIFLWVGRIYAFLFLCHVPEEVARNLNHLRDLKNKLPVVPANSPGYFAYSLVEKLQGII